MKRLIVGLCLLMLLSIPAMGAQSYLSLYDSPDNLVRVGPGGAWVTLLWDNTTAADTANIVNKVSGYPAGTDTTVTFSAANNTSLSAGLAIPRIPVCRTIDATVCDIDGANNNDIKAVTITLYGTNMLDESISSTFSVTDNTAGTIAGTKAFKTITYATIPKMDGAGARVSFGLGNDVGLPFTIPVAGVDAVYTDGTSRTVTQTFDGTDIEKNILTAASYPPDGSLEYIARVWIPSMGLAVTHGSAVPQLH